MKANFSAGCQRSPTTCERSATRMAFFQLAVVLAAFSSVARSSSGISEKVRFGRMRLKAAAIPGMPEQTNTVRELAIIDSHSVT